MKKRLGIGTYRLVAGNATHEHSFRLALEKRAFGVIDTSPNYGDGLAEVLVGSVLGERREKGQSLPQVMSKFGFIQGQTLEAHKSKPFKGAVEYTPDCFHCIDPEFMEHELNGSLTRLGVQTLDTYLVHNPEHFLLSKIPPDGQTDALTKAMQEELLEKLLDSFTALEHQVAAGRIKQYGVSSNSFALPAEHPHFVPFEKLPDIAEKAARLAGRNKPSLKVFQFPGNVIERTALAPKGAGGNGCAQFAAQHGIETIVNRAITAFDSVGSWRLADAPFPVKYSASRDALAEHLSPPSQDTSSWSAEERQEWEETLEACAWLVRLVGDMDAQLGAFSSVMHYQDDLMRKIIPMINSKLDGMDEETSTLLFAFFSEYEKAVRSVTGEQTRTHVIEDISSDKALQAWKGSAEDFVAPSLPINLVKEEPLEEYALRWLKAQPHVQTVLLGVTRPEYVEQSASIFDD